jgi:hypothetical protein
MIAFRLVFLFIAAIVSQTSVLTFTRVPNPITVGEPQAITYSTNDTTSPISIILKKGPANGLVKIEVLTGKHLQFDDFEPDAERVSF